jgi:hypothetical protein
VGLGQFELADLFCRGVSIENGHLAIHYDSGIVTGGPLGDAFFPIARDVDFEAEALEHGPADALVDQIVFDNQNLFGMFD